MAEFCKECSIAHFGQDHKDFANLFEPEEYTDEEGALVLCECCGPIVVDINGKRMTDDFGKNCDCALMLGKRHAIKEEKDETLENSNRP